MGIKAVPGDQSCADEDGEDEEQEVLGRQTWRKQQQSSDCC